MTLWLLTQKLDFTGLIAFLTLLQNRTLEARTIVYTNKGHTKRIERKITNSKPPPGCVHSSDHHLHHHHNRHDRYHQEDIKGLKYLL
jgi:hypothetical protein